MTAADRAELWAFCRPYRDCCPYAVLSSPQMEEIAKPHKGWKAQSGETGRLHIMPVFIGLNAVLPAWNKGRSIKEDVWRKTLFLNET